MSVNTAVAADAAAPADVPGDVGRRVRGHMPVLDGLRGLAIAVVLAHSVSIYQKHAPSTLLRILYFVQAPGWVGVQLFFVLSGFLITGILLDTRGRPHALRTFWIRRTLRIFPPYYALLLLVTVVVPHLPAAPAPLLIGLQDRAWYWAYLSNWVQPWGLEMPALSHTWSLAIEEQFYLVWPLVVFALAERSLLRACLALAVGALLVRAGLLFFHQSGVAVYEYAFARIDALTLGAACALVARRPEWLDRVARHIPRTLVACAALLLGMWPFTRGFNMFNPWVQIVGYGVLSVFFAAFLLAAVLWPTAFVARVLSAPWLRWVGKYSYGIYLFHGPISVALAPHFSPTFNQGTPAAALGALLAFEASVVVASVLAALASWNLVERWALGLKDRWATRADAAVTA